MANKHKTLQSLFTEIAKSIRACKQSTDPIVADDFPEAILELDTAGATASPREICLDKTAWVDGKLVTGTGLIYNQKDTHESNKIPLVNVETNKSFGIISGWVTIVTSEVTGTCRFACTMKPDGTISGSTNSTNYSLTSVAYSGGYRLYLDFSKFMNAYRPPSGVHTIDTINCEYYYRVF